MSEAKFKVGDKVVATTYAAGVKSGVVAEVYPDLSAQYTYRLDLYGKGEWYAGEAMLLDADEYFGTKKDEEEGDRFSIGHVPYHVCRDNIVNAGFTSYKPVCKVCDRDIQPWELPNEKQEA